MIRIKRLFKSFIYAFRGLKTIFKEEQNFKIEVFIGLIVIILAVYLKFDYIEIVILILTIGFVLLAEVVNSVVELISDILKPKLDHYVKKIKDMVAAVVMVASFVAVIIGIIIFVKNLFL